MNPFHATGLFLYPLKTSGNHRFSDVFSGYRKRPVVRDFIYFDHFLHTFYPANIYLFKVNNGIITAMCEICSNLLTSKFDLRPSSHSKTFEADNCALKPLSPN